MGEHILSFNRWLEQMGDGEREGREIERHSKREGEKKRERGEIET